jgi:putative acetyltransferase
VNIRFERFQDRDPSIEVQREVFETATEAHIVVAIRDEVGSFAFVADEDGRVVGHVQVSRAWAGETGILALGPIGVLPDHQGRGIGRGLIEAAVAEARSRGEVAIILLGEPSFYPRFGFEPASRYGLKNPFSDVRQEVFQILPLDGRVNDLTGDVRWHPVFNSGTG